MSIENETHCTRFTRAVRFISFVVHQPSAWWFRPDAEMVCSLCSFSILISSI